MCLERGRAEGVDVVYLCATCTHRIMFVWVSFECMQGFWECMQGSFGCTLDFLSVCRGVLSVCRALWSLGREFWSVRRAGAWGCSLCESR